MLNRVFTGGRPVRDNLIASPETAAFGGLHTVNLRYSGWNQGDVLVIEATAIRYAATANLSSDYVDVQQQFRIDTGSFPEGAVDQSQRRTQFIPTTWTQDADGADEPAITLANSAIMAYFFLNPLDKTKLSFFAEAPVGAVNGDVGLRVWNIWRLR